MFLNRIDEPVIFHALGAGHVRSIAKIQLRQLESRLDKLAMKLGVSETALDELTKVGFDPVFGARPLKRAIQQRVVNPLPADPGRQVRTQGRDPGQCGGGEFSFGRVVH